MMTYQNQPKRKRHMGWIIAVIVGSVLLTLVLCSLCAFSLFPFLRPGSKTQGGLLSGIRPKSIFMLSPDEGWIVGRGFSPHDLDFRPSHTENLHYSNGHWSQVKSPQVGFSCLSMLSSNNVWAGTDDGFYHWDGEQWTRDASFEFPKGPFAGSSQNIVDISMLSSTEGWALSINRTDNLLHYTKGKWQVGDSLVTDKYYSMLSSISMVSANDGWAVGYHFMAHYDGTHWSLVDTPVTHHTDAADIDLISVKMISHDEGWAVGNIGPRYQQSSSIISQKGVILHYSKGAWSIVNTVPVILTGLSMVSASEGWAVGGLWTSNTNFLHYTNGKWIPVARPQNAPKDASGVQNVMTISMVSASEGWGISEDGIYRYHDGAWSTWYVRGPNEIM